MSQLNSNEGWAEPLGLVRTAAATAEKLSRRSGEFDYYVHKWTKQRRRYAAEDLYLPEKIYVRGRWPSWNQHVISIGGTRTPTVETFCLVPRVVRELAKAGVLIISGAVPGVDLAAHLATLDEPGASTIAVLANPVNLGLQGHEWYSSLVQLEILNRGAFVSEYSETCEVFGFEYCQRLLARDRIISGLCDVFLAFECNEDSATVDTAHRAIQQGKRVICVESVGRSARQGIEQMRSLFSTPVLKERDNSASTIAQAILRSLGTAKFGVGPK